MAEVQVGQTVTRKITSHSDEAGVGLSGPFDGTVVYVHPKKRFHIVEFDIPGIPKYRESYMGVDETPEYLKKEVSKRVVNRQIQEENSEVIS